jgi:hypothetical protein
MAFVQRKPRGILKPGYIGRPGCQEGTETPGGCFSPERRIIENTQHCPLALKAK